MKLEELLLKIETSIVELINSHLRNLRKEEGSFSFWDGLMKKKWTNLINPPLVYFKKRKEARESCKWSPPPHGWYKLNFYGAARGNPGTLGIGCIINYDSRKWIAKKGLSIWPTSNNLAELEALEKGLLLCLELGLERVIIEADSRIILNVLRKCATPNWVLNSKLGDVLNILGQFIDCHIDHIF